jgi:hypothetical protein
MYIQYFPALVNLKSASVNRPRTDLGSQSNKIIFSSAESFICCCWVLDRVARLVFVQTYQNGKNLPHDHKLYQTVIDYTKWVYNIPNGPKIYQHFPFQGTPKYTQIGIFGTKINHLATLIEGRTCYLHR